MHSRIARLVLGLLLLAPTLWRAWAALPAPVRACVPEGRGAGAATWVGCTTDPGPRRELTGRERLAFGLPLDVNRASTGDLAEVPGLTRRLAAAVIADRELHGSFPSVESLDRVPGIGPRRLEQARGHLVAE